MILYDQERATPAQRLSQLRCASQLSVGTWVECRGRIGLKPRTAPPLYERFCLKLHVLHAHQDPYAELHHWLMLQRSRDTLFPKNSTALPVSLPVRVCQLLQEHVSLSFEQLSTHLSLGVSLLRDTITEVHDRIRQVID